MHSVRMCEEQLANSKSIAIIAHQNPDADTLCSAVALKRLIKTNFSDTEEKTIDIFVDCEEIGEIYQPILKGVELNQQNCPQYDLAITVDCASLTRCGKYSEIFNQAKDTLNIDHHDTNDNFANNNLVFKSSSTCEGLYSMFDIRQKIIPDDVCKLIYSGIITDTNNLTSGNVTIRTHKVIAAFMSRHIDLETLKQHFFKNNTKSKAFLLQKALSTLNFYAGDRIAFMKLTKQDFIDTDSTFEDTLGIVNHGVEIKGVEIAIIAIKQADNSYYVSLRSKTNIDVGEIAKQMGGGGHETIAAFTYDGSIVEMRDSLLAICREELKKHPNINIDDDLFAEEPTEQKNSD